MEQSIGKKKVINILFLGGAKRVSFARMLKATGKKMDLEVNIYSYELSLEVPIAAEGQVVIGKKWHDPKVVDHLQATVGKYAIDIILPFVDPAIEIAGKYAAQYSDAWVPVVDPALARTLFDKAESARLYASHNIPIPPTYTGGRPHFPLIAKPRKGSASKGITVINNVADFRRITATDEYLLEKYIARHKEFTVDAYINRKGEIMCVSPRLRVEVLGGEVSRSVTIDSPQLVKLATRTIEKLRLRGPVTLQFLKDTTDDSLMLMEINPRLGGGVVCSVHAGADIPRFILEEYLGIPSHPVSEVKPGVLICRYFEETVFNA